MEMYPWFTTDALTCPPETEGDRMNQAAPARTGPCPPGLTLVGTAVQRLPAAKTTCCMRSSLAATSSSCTLKPMLARKSRYGVGPDIWSVDGGKPYASVLTTTLLKLKLGVVLNELVFVRAHTDTRLSTV